MANTPPWGRYAELRPEQLETIMAVAPVAYVPWGALEWHGPHLPFGLDGFTAEGVAERVVQRTGGVLLPTTWWPITALPHRFSLSIGSDVVQALWDGIFAELARAGFKLVVLLSGHYAQGHELVLMDAAEHAIAAHGALLLALRPRLVALHKLDAAPLHPSTSAVLGDDPRRATAGQGESALTLAAERLIVGVDALLHHGGPDVLRELYARRRATYQQYVDRYFRGSWEEAITDWWGEKIRVQS